MGEGKVRQSLTDEGRRNPESRPNAKRLAYGWGSTTVVRIGFNWTASDQHVFEWGLNGPAVGR